jgi:hypothetical protein
MCAHVQVVAEVLKLSRNPEVIREIAKAKDEAFDRIHAIDLQLPPLPGVVSLLRSLAFHDVRPCTLVSRIVDSAAHAIRDPCP